MRNVRESDDGTILTGGFGIGSKWLMLDVSGQYSTEKGDFEGKDYPAYGWVQVGLIVRI